MFRDIDVIFIVFTVLLISGCTGPVEDGKLSYTPRDNGQIVILSMLLDSTGIDYELRGNTFYYQADNWEKFSEAEEDSFSAKKIWIKNIDDKIYLESLLNESETRFLQVQKEEMYLFLWWPISNRQEELILLDLVNKQLKGSE